MDKVVPVVEAYRKSLDLFKDRSRFTQGYYQKDKNGANCPWREGYCFCVLGAVIFFSDGHSHRATCCLQRVSEHLFEGVHIQHINDGPDGYEKIQQALQFAINLWDGYEPTEEELGLPVTEILRRRANG